MIFSEEHDLSELLSHLLLADHIIIVTDNIRFLSQPHIASLVRTFSHHPSAQLVLNRIATSASTIAEDEAEIGAEAITGMLGGSCGILSHWEGIVNRANAAMKSSQ